VCRFSFLSSCLLWWYTTRDTEPTRNDTAVPATTAERCIPCGPKPHNLSAVWCMIGKQTNTDLRWTQSWRGKRIHNIGNTYKGRYIDIVARPRMSPLVNEWQCFCVRRIVAEVLETHVEDANSSTVIRVSECSVCIFHESHPGDPSTISHYKVLMANFVKNEFRRTNLLNIFTVYIRAYQKS
jgi:hypothetical protein